MWVARLSTPVTNADIQAILWYPEKDLWAQLRGEGESSLKQPYDEEFLKIAEARGLGQQAREAVDDDTYSGAGETACRRYPAVYRSRASRERFSDVSTDARGRHTFAKTCLASVRVLSSSILGLCGDSSGDIGYGLFFPPRSCSP